MIYFIKDNTDIYSYTETDVANGYGVGMVQLTEEEYQAMIASTQEELVVIQINNYKSLYLEIINAKLKELDYDSLATVKLWENDANFGTEATRILTWYKAIINKNYELQNAGILLTDAEYLVEINGIVY